MSRTSKKSKHRQSLYSIDFSRPVDAIRGAHPNDAYDDDDLMMGAGGGGGAPSSLSPKPMTPRRVKRRSVMQRGTSGGGTVGRQSTSSRRGHSSSSAGSGAIASGSGGGAGHHHHHHHHHHRSSVRNSRRKTTHQNPVTKLLNQQQQHLQQQQQQHRLHHHGDALAGLEDAAGTMTLTKTFPPFVHNKNPDLTESNLKSLNNDYMLGQLNNFGQPVGAVGEAVVPGNNLNTFGAHHHHAAVQPPLPPHRRQALVHTPTFLDGDTASSPIDPIYYNMNSSSPLLQQQTSWGVSTSSPQGMVGTVPGGGIHAGLSNPVYQHSTTNLNHSPELNEEYYGTNGQNRPPSVRSSYSNFHGTRPLSSYLGGGGTGGVAQPGGITNRGYNVSPPGQQGGTTAGGGQVENVFANLTSGGGGGGHTNHQQQYGGSAGGTDPIAIPQLPHRRSVSRESIRAMQFLNSGPPAYNLNYHTPPDSETTM
uniref:Uncharacterized protein n=1 Tax=Anopheles merus TaxID=30066 RepID=A0A182UTS7_ANOME